MRTKKNAILFLLLGALGAAWAGPLQKVGFESRDGACRAWWQFDAKGALPSYFARVTDGGKGVEAGFAGVEWDEAVQAPATAGVARARVVVRESAGKRVAVFHDYASSCSGEYRDYVVEPFKMDVNCVNVAALDLNSGHNKIFKVARIGEVELLPEMWTREKEHKYPKLDVFPNIWNNYLLDEVGKGGVL